MSARKNWE
jgi:hypothetical protein